MARQHRVVVVERDQVGRCAAADPRGCLAARSRAAFHGAFEQLAAHVSAAERGDVAGLRCEPLPVFQPAQLLERVDRDVAVRADGQPAAVAEVIRQREQPVAEIGFRARADADDGAGLGEALRFVGVHVRRVHEAPLPVDADVLQQPANRAPLVGREALVDLALLLRDMQMDRPARLAARVRDRGQRRGAHGAQAVCADADIELRRLLRSRGFVMIEELIQRQREQRLRSLGPRRMEAGAFVEYGHVGQPDAGVPCRGGKRCEHLHAGRIVGRVAVQVVELDDGRVAALQHLRVDLAGDRVQQAGIDGGREPVHAFAPGPEVVATRRRTFLGAAGERPLEGVTVGVAEPGDDAAGGDGLGVARCARDHRVDPAAADAQQDVVGPAVG